MRTLKFIIEGQIIKPDPSCDFSNIIPGTEGYLQLDIEFSSEWDDCAKAVGFFSMNGKEYLPQVLKDGRTCMIPKEALKNRKFKIQVVGVRPGYSINTNKIIINQDGGKDE